MPGRTQRSPRWTFHLSGGSACLDLANTVSWRRSRQPIERLNEYLDVVEWARQSRVLTAGDTRGLVREARRRPVTAARVLARTRALREAIYRVASGLAGGRRPRPVDLARLDRELHDALRNLHLTPRRSGAALTWSGRPGQLARPLWIAARSAAAVFTSADVGRLKTCPASNCGWVFLDTTKNGTRRWCDMRVCGNRAKARTFSARQSARRGAIRTERGPARP